MKKINMLACANNEDEQKPAAYCNCLRSLFLFLMVGSIVFVASILPLRALFFYRAFPVTQLEDWLLFPTRFFFSGEAIVPSRHFTSMPPLTSSAISWLEVWLLMAGFTLIFVIYLLALRSFQRYVTFRYILFSTFLLGLLCMFIPVVTSQDLFSYIDYARMGVIYGLNPLTTLPSTISADPVYPYIAWVDQPSAYGPTWIAIISFLQWLALLLGFKHMLVMVLLLRFLGLSMHLGSIWLIWSISGVVQDRYEINALQVRLIATFAFAWNPLLLFEACTNAHCDTTVLFLVLLALWFLRVWKPGTVRPCLFAAFVLAIAACLKINYILLFPGLLLFLWAQQWATIWWRLRSVVLTGLAYGGIIGLLYAPFWQHGEILRVFRVNPGTTRDINSVYEFLVRFSSSIQGKVLPVVSLDTGSPSEIFSHEISILLFGCIYGGICIRCLIVPQRINSLVALLRWMALIWLLYCLIGSPWFWPWYMSVFFGLSALIIAIHSSDAEQLITWRYSLALLLSGFNMLSIYCFFTWQLHESYIPYLSYFQLTYLRGLWAWLSLFLLIRSPRFSRWRLFWFWQRKRPRLASALSLHTQALEKTE